MLFSLFSMRQHRACEPSQERKRWAAFICCFELRDVWKYISTAIYEALYIFLWVLYFELYMKSCLRCDIERKSASIMFMLWGEYCIMAFLASYRRLREPLFKSESRRYFLLYRRVGQLYYIIYRAAYTAGGYSRRVLSMFIRYNATDNHDQ